MYLRLLRPRHLAGTLATIKMKLSLNSILIALLTVIGASGCQNKHKEIELNFVTEIKTIVHQNSSLHKSESFENYLKIGEGEKTIYELTVKNDIEGVTDVVNWRKTFFYLNDKLQTDRIYYLQNEDELKSYSFIGGAWIGIEKLYGTNGAFKVRSITDSSLQIDVLGDWEADLLKSDTVEHIKIISDTTLTFIN